MANGVHLLEAFRPRGSANAIALLEQAQSGVGHVLATRCGGRVTARKFWAKPACDPPIVPIFPTTTAAWPAIRPCRSRPVALPSQGRGNRPRSPPTDECRESSGRQRRSGPPAGRTPCEPALRDRRSAAVKHAARVPCRWEVQVGGEPLAVAHRHHFVFSVTVAETGRRFGGSNERRTRSMTASERNGSGSRESLWWEAHPVGDAPESEGEPRVVSALDNHGARANGNRDGSRNSILHVRKWPAICWSRLEFGHE